MSVVNAAEIQDMVRHWLRTPPNGYHGSGYGSDVHALLQQPISEALADELLDKLRADVPILTALPAGAVNIYAENVDKENKRLLIEVFDSLIAIDANGVVI